MDRIRKEEFEKFLDGGERRYSGCSNLVYYGFSDIIEELKDSRHYNKKTDDRVFTAQCISGKIMIKEILRCGLYITTDEMLIDSCMNCAQYKKAKLKLFLADCEKYKWVE